MKEILKAFTVRINKNGVEVPKPEDYEFYLTGGFNINENKNWQVKCEYFSNCKEVIKLPTLIEFIETIEVTHFNDKSYIGTITLMYKDFVKTQLSKGQFVVCDTEGNILDDPSDSRKWSMWTDKERSVLCDNYEDGKERVIFEDTKDAFFEMMSDKFTTDFEGKEVYTIDNGNFDEHYYTINQALNNGVKLYMKIK